MGATTIDGIEAAGMAALVRAGESGEWFAGHFGAAMISGARLLRDPDLPGPAAMALSKRLSEWTAAHRDWYAPLALEEGEAADPDALHAVLRRHASRLRTSGHPTIYLATALELLARRPEWARARAIEALLRLHAAGQEDDPARYFGVDDYFACVDRDAAAPSGAVPTEALGAEPALRRAVEALDPLASDRTIDGRRYFLTGEKIHLWTLAHAIDLFDRLGLWAIAADASRAHADLARLVGPSHAVEPTSIAPAGCDPFDARFWEQEPLDLLHVVKLAEAVVALLPRLPGAERAVARERLGRVWALLGLR